MNTFSRSGILVLTFCALSTLPRITSAQGDSTTASAGSGRIIGKVLDSRTGGGLTDVAIQLVGTTTGTSSGLEGRYVLGRVPAGTVTLHIRRLGFAPKTITGVMLDAGKTIEQDIALDPVTVSLETQVVTASIERGSVNNALDRQRTATGVVNSVSREQISKSPDGDAAQAVQRVSGVTVQDGKYVFVRGLGERYTTTSLNGSRIPSPEPERKVVPLDLFPSALIQSVTTSKNFTADQPGDFSGAQVDIRTREFPLGQQSEFSTSIGFNDAATNRGLVVAPSLSQDWLGFAGSERQLPGGLAGPLPQQPSQSTVNSIVRSFRNVWSPLAKKGVPNKSLGMTTGGSKPFGETSQLGYIAALSYSYNQEVREREVRAYAEPTDGTTEIDRFEGTTGRSSVLWGGIANLSMNLGSKTRISLNNTYNQSADNEARMETGFSENLGTRLRIDRLRFVERTVRSNQIVGERQLGARQRVNLSFTSSNVKRSEPDRSEFVQVEGAPGDSPYWLDATEGAVRTFGRLTESGLNTALDYTLQFGPANRQHELKLGGLHRYTERVSRNQVFSIQAPSLTLDERKLRPEQIFDGRFAESSDAVFRVVPLSQGGSYGASDELGAGYSTVEWALSDRYRLITGARLERSSTIVSAEPTVGNRVRVNPLYTDVLPSLLFNVKMTDAQNLRFSATRTLSRPEYRELAEVQYRDVIGGENVIGNPALQRTLISNFDARWEWYPDAGEVFSVGLFAKRFDKPIERIFLATSGTRIVTFINADGGDNLGLELDARVGLGRVAGVFQPFTLFSNATFMRSKVRLGDDPRVAQEDRAMVGQAPSVVNTGLTFAPGSGSLSATVLFNRVGRRIVSASQRPLPVTYEEARSVLDLALRFPLLASVSAKLDAKNLLDQPYVQRQGTVTREAYYAGRVYTFGLNWQP